MKYFNLRLLSSDSKLLVDDDIYPDSFRYLVQVLGDRLSNGGYAHSHERFKIRIIPRWDGVPDLQRFIQVDEPYKDLGNSTVAIQINGKMYDKPVKFCTVRLYSSDRQLAYQLDYEPSSLFKGALERVFTDATRKGLIKVDENVRFELYIKASGELNIKKRSAIMPVYIQFAHSTTSTPKPQKNNIVKIKEKVPLFERLPKKRVFFTEIEKYQDPKGSTLQIYMQKQAYHSLKTSVQISKTRQAEVAGVLLGNLCEDDKGIFLDISTYVFPDEAVGTFYAVRIDADLWMKIINDVNMAHPDKIILGWFHTHLTSKVDINFAGEKRDLFRASRRSFLSYEDHFIHNSFFTQEWHVAFLIDLSVNQDLFYFRYQNQLVDSGGFYLYQSYTAK